MWSMTCSIAIPPAIENSSTTVATRFTRRVALILISESGSFQISALEDQHRSRDGHRRIEQRVCAVVQNQAPGHSIAVRHLADYVQGGKIRHKVGNDPR